MMELFLGTTIFIPLELVQRPVWAAHCPVPQRHGQPPMAAGATNRGVGDGS